LQGGARPIEALLNPIFGVIIYRLFIRKRLTEREVAMILFFINSDGQQIAQALNLIE
jgi:hypothetical protein